MARNITYEVLDDFNKWTTEAPMFTSSSQGEEFAKEMRAVIKMARFFLDSQSAQRVVDNFVISVGFPD